MSSSVHAGSWMQAVPSLELIQAERARRSTSSVVGGVQLSLDESKQACRAKLSEFIRQAWHIVVPEQPYVHNWHIDFMCAHLEAITNGDLLRRGYANRLLANVPPGTMKSLIVTVFWPAWEQGPRDKQGLQYLAASYRLDHCIRDTRRYAKLVISGWYQERWPMELVYNGSTHVENTRGGWRKCAPFSSLTGQRCDRLLIDDPHSIDTAESDVERASAIRRFRERAGASSSNDPLQSVIVVIMQRLHQKDLTGVILELGLNYVHVRLPMRFESGIDDQTKKPLRCVTPWGKDPRTKEGELLDYNRTPPIALDEQEKTMTAYAIASQHQQRPTPRGGLLFNRAWFNIVKASPAHCRRVRGWDIAASDGASSAFTCGVRLAYDARAKMYYIEAVDRQRTTNPERFITTIAAQDGKGVEVDLPQDPGAAGKLVARSMVAALTGYNVHASPESGDKVQRASPVAAQAEFGNIVLVEGAWNEPFLNEAESFPTGAFKDQIDALSRAFGRIVMMASGMIVMPIVMSTARTHFADHTGEGM